MTHDIVLTSIQRCAMSCDVASTLKRRRLSTSFSDYKGETVSIEQNVTIEFVKRHTNFGL